MDAAPSCRFLTAQPLGDLPVLSRVIRGTAKPPFQFRPPSLGTRGASQAPLVHPCLGQSTPMELTWQGRFCVRMRSREATVVADPFPADVGPTGRGLSGDIVTFSHDEPLPAGALRQ